MVIISQYTSEFNKKHLFYWIDIIKIFVVSIYLLNIDYTYTHKKNLI